MNPRRRLLAAGLAANLLAGLAPARAARPKVLGYLSAGNPGDDIVRALAARLAVARLGTGFVEAGGLMNVMMDFSDRLVRVADILAKVLAGANPAEMPFELADRTRFELNRATARAIGVPLPPELLLRATRVIG